MQSYKVGTIVGSLSSTSINRKLAEALIKLAPEGMVFEEISIKALPLYSSDYDSAYPEVAKDFKGCGEQVPRDSVRYAGIQPVDSGCTQERHRLGEPALGHQFICEKAICRDWNLSRRNRHGGGSAEPSKCLELSQCAPDELAGGVHHLQLGFDR